uniref:nucleoside hydrolase n=1 Tax=Vaginimicrobium propionicum TaxID=1871034 RepID=UPI000970F7A4|nr:nucleoside hydrolase [Vaginimicrobium propionicum]
MSEIKLILDCDPGSDDAVAIMLASLSERINLLGITVVNGNRILPKTLENALRVVQFLGKDIPVFAGAETALVSGLIKSRKPDLPRVTLNDSHGDYLALEPARIKPQPKRAAQWLVETLMESDGEISIAAVGPLTNLALALRLEPRIENKIKQLVIMGGGIVGSNATQSAEFNFYADPESAKIVMGSTIPKMILPLDATWRACITLDQCVQLRELGTKWANYTADLVELRVKGLQVNDACEHNAKLRHTPGTVGSTLLYRYENDMAPVHDALAVAYLLEPSLVKEYIEANVDIDIAGGLADGRMVVDLHNKKKGSEPLNAKVAIDADGETFYKLLLTAFSE